MSMQPEDTVGPFRGKNGALLDVLIALALLVGLATLIGLVAGIFLIVRKPPSPEAATLLALTTLLVMGLGSFGILLVILGLARPLRQAMEKLESLDQRAAVLAEHTVSRPAQSDATPQPRPELLEVTHLLAEIRENLLLPPDERDRRFRRLAERELLRGLALVEQFVNSRDFHRGRDALVALADRFSNDERIRQAGEKLERAAEAARITEIEQATHMMEHQIGLGQWQDAESIARELAAKYPASPEATGLVERVRRERQQYEQRYRQRLFEEIQQSVSQRRWRDAAEATRKFISNFPSGPDTDALRIQLETLDANADIQSRQELELQLKEFVRQQKYWDAVALARRIIAEHPLSPQANVLRAQIGRLEELAHRTEPQK
jgi:hypothetical protein